MEARNTTEPPKNSLGEPANVVEKAYDPGWNDPPPMSYESASGPVKKGILNKPKRIAFPLDTSHSPTSLASSPRNVSGPTITPHLPPNSSKQSPVPPLPMPPMHSSLPPLAASEKTNIITAERNVVDTTGDITTAASNKEQSIESVQAVFNKILDTINEIKDVTEIKKRLGVMAVMWTSNKLDIKVQQQMFLLAEALDKGQLAAANEIQKSLAVNHTSQCSTWMAGVRKLVQYASSENASLVQTSIGSDQTEKIGGGNSMVASSDVSEVDVLATKVQDL